MVFCNWLFSLSIVFPSLPSSPSFLPSLSPSLSESQNQFILRSWVFLITQTRQYFTWAGGSSLQVGVLLQALQGLGMGLKASVFQVWCSVQWHRLSGSAAPDQLTQNLHFNDVPTWLVLWTLGRNIHLMWTLRRNLSAAMDSPRSTKGPDFINNKSLAAVCWQGRLCLYCTLYIPQRTSAWTLGFLH